MPDPEHNRAGSILICTNLGLAGMLNEDRQKRVNGRRAEATEVDPVRDLQQALRPSAKDLLAAPEPRGELIPRARGGSRRRIRCSEADR